MSSNLSENYPRLVHLLRTHRYKLIHRTANDITEVSSKYTDLKPKLNQFILNNGTKRPMMTLVGTIPVEQEGSSNHNIPLVIWIPTNYGTENSKVQIFLTPTRKLVPMERIILQKGAIIDENGKVNLSLLHKSRRGLVGLIDKMISVLRNQLPFNFVSGSTHELLKSKEETPSYFLKMSRSMSFNNSGKSSFF